MHKVSKLQIAQDFLERNGRITAMDIIHECRTDSPHKYLQLLRKKIGLIELEDNEKRNYKIFIKAEKQLNLGL